jgi:hypothetical protein
LCVWHSILLRRCRSTPPRVAAVLATEKGLWYIDCAPDGTVLAQFRPRGDNQIASLEMLAIAYGTWLLQLVAFMIVCIGLVSGLSTFAGDIRGRKVVVHSDNTVAEYGMRKGRARSFDHTAVVHSVW